MKFRDILVHIDDAPQCAARLELALGLASRYGAKVTGLYVITHQQYKSTGEAAAHRAMEAEAAFQLQVKAAGVRGEWLLADSGVVGVDLVEVVNHYSHAKDLVVVGQTDPNAPVDGVPEDLPERVVLGSGRPVLVVPFAGSFSGVGERIIVGWRSGRASARAVNDAMPFLLDAAQISVLRIKMVGGKKGSVSPGADDGICDHLRLFNPNVVEEKLVTGEIPVADIMMNYAWENGFDLIVLGAYAHSSQRSLTLGPVAKDILGKMTVPVLMSH